MTRCASCDEWNGYFHARQRRDGVIGSPYAAVVADFLETPFREGALPSKVKELVALAVHASPSTLNRPAIAFHARRAREAGASDPEIEEVLAMISVLGVHAFHVGVPTLLSELHQAGRHAEAELPPLTTEMQILKDEFIASRGYWTEQRDMLASLVPEFFHAYMALANEPWRHGVLERKVRELIYIAIDASITHMYEFGLRIHIRNALAEGASRQEILEVFEIAASLGASSYAAGMNALAESKPTAP